MPQPSKSEVAARLRARYGNQAGSVSTGGGKNRMRRKKFRQKKSTNEFEKRLQANLKKLSCNTIPGIEEVNLFKSDGTVIHFVSPKVDAEVSSNTFIVSGQYTHNKIEELLPDILPQIGSDHLTQLKDYAEKFEALKPMNDNDDDMNNASNDMDDVPMLIDEDLNFEQVAQSDNKKPDEATTTDAKADDSKADDAKADDATAATEATDETKPKDDDVVVAAPTDDTAAAVVVPPPSDKKEETQNDEPANDDNSKNELKADDASEVKPAATAAVVSAPTDDKPAEPTAEVVKEVTTNDDKPAPTTST